MKTGLSSKKAEENIRNLGLNEIKQTKPKKWYHYFLESLFTPFNCILIGISIILIYTDIYLSEKPSYANIVVIAILVIASTLIICVLAGGIYALVALFEKRVNKKNNFKR